jgi:DNA-binding NarL/FixJ family response regulator
MSTSYQNDKLNSGDSTRQSFYIKPNVNLLDNRQWQYVKRYCRLSPREIEVARLVCCGLGNEEVAERLKITGGTVKTHLRNIYRRVRVNNKIGMLLRFVEMTVDLYPKEPVVKDSIHDHGQRQAGLRG